MRIKAMIAQVARMLKNRINIDRQTKVTFIQDLSIQKSKSFFMISKVKIWMIMVMMKIPG